MVYEFWEGLGMVKNVGAGACMELSYFFRDPKLTDRISQTTIHGFYFLLPRKYLTEVFSD